MWTLTAVGFAHRPGRAAPVRSPSLVRPHGRPRPQAQGSGELQVEVSAVQTVELVELDRAVQLDHDVAARRGQQVDPYEVGPEGRGGGDPETAFRGRGEHGFAGAAQREVGAPVAWSCDAPNRADDLAGGDEEPEIVACRRYELLYERALSKSGRSTSSGASWFSRSAVFG